MVGFVAGSRPRRAGATRRRAHAGSVRRVTVATWWRLPRLRRGRFGSGMSGASWAGCGFVGGCAGPSRQPTTRASRADHHPTRQRPTVRQGRPDVAGRAEARSPGGRVNGRREGRRSQACGGRKPDAVKSPSNP